MTLVAVGVGDDLAPRRNRRAIHREVDDLVRRAVSNTLLLRCSWEQSLTPPRFYADRISSRCLPRNGVGERVSAVPTRVATRLRRAFGHVARRARCIASKAGVTVVAGGTSHGERD